MATLDISGKKIETVLKKCKTSGIVEEDKRGYKPAPNKNQKIGRTSFEHI